MRSRVIKTKQQADNTYVPRRRQRKIPKKKYLLRHKQESPQHSTTATTATGVEDAIQESGAEHLTTTNKASGVEEIVVESDADSIAYSSDSSTPQTIMDPMREMLEIVRQMVEDNKAERDHQMAERERLKLESEQTKKQFEESLKAEKDREETIRQREQEDYRKRREEEEVRRKVMEKERIAEKAVEKIPAMTRHDDVELYIQGLENDLQQANIPLNRWKLILTTRLTPILKDFIRDLQADPAYTFADVKSRLLDSVGQTPTQAGQLLFEMKQKDVQGKSTAQLIQYTERLLIRVTKEATTPTECVVKLLIARVCSLLSTRARQYTNSQNITDMADFRRVLQSWESTESALIPEEKWSKPAKNFGVGTCFKCEKLGHHAAECRFNAEPQQKQTLH